MVPDTHCRPEFTRAGTLVVVAVAAVAVILAIGVAAGWFTATMIVAAALLSAILGLGWYHALAPLHRAEHAAVDHHWFYFVLVAAAVAAAPLVPVLVIKGMDHYGFVSVLRPLPFAPNDRLRDTR